MWYSGYIRSIKGYTVLFTASHYFSNCPSFPQRQQVIIIIFSTIHFRDVCTKPVTPLVSVRLRIARMYLTLQPSYIYIEYIWGDIYPNYAVSAAVCWSSYVDPVPSGHIGSSSETPKLIIPFATSSVSNQSGTSRMRTRVSSLLTTISLIFSSSKMALSSPSILKMIPPAFVNLVVRTLTTRSVKLTPGKPFSLPPKGFPDRLKGDQ